MTSRFTKNSKISSLYIAAFGDVHTGHPNTPTTHILKSLRLAFPDSPKTGDLDIIFIEGDFFDRQLNLPDPNVYEIKLWIGSFLRMCAERDIVVRVLEGTPSHDWKQPKLFTTINDISKIGADVKYVDELSIEYMERFDINVLYVPDEWRVKCDDTWNEVVQLLASKNLQQVDFAVMHGAFPHQMPKNIHHQLELHDPSRYFSIVKHYIFVGHIHNHSIHANILAAGSFDRTAHGEESPKGHIRVLLQDGAEDIVEFIENENALKYITIDCIGVLPEYLHELIAEKVEHLPPGSHVRIKALKGEAAIVGKDHFENVYPQLHWTVKEAGKGFDSHVPVLVDTRKLHKTINITASNIQALLIERIQQKHPQLDLERSVSLLEGVING